MSKARDLANAGTALTTVSATELGYLDGVTSAVQTQINSKIGSASAINPTIVDAKGDLIAATAADTVARLAVGTNNQVLTADSAEATGMKWVTPASSQISWTNRKEGSASQLLGLASNGTNIYVAAGVAGSLFSSPDGITWTSRTSGFGANIIQDVQFGNGLFVAVGNNGTITTSTDGTTWTARTANMGTNTIRKVLYANSLWVAIGDGGGATNTGGITYSSDGLTWTRKSQSPAVGTSYYDLIWNGTNWIVGTSGAANTYLYATTPSGTWTAGAALTTDDIRSMIWDGTRAIYSSGAPSMVQVTGTTLASGAVLSAPSFGTGAVNAKFLYSGVVYTGARFFSKFTPSASLYPSTIFQCMLPSVYDSGNGALGGATLTAIYVNANGIIITDSAGRIYTSF